MLLLLYEFEACVKLNDSSAENILEKALTMPQPEPKLFESLAGMYVSRYFVIPYCFKTI